MDKATERKAICIDFDGVIHGYQSGWQGEASCPDPPVSGAIEFIRTALVDYDIVIHSTRANSERGRRAIEKYLRDNGLSEDALRHITLSPKPKAIAYIDDRAFRFEGSWPSLGELVSMEPWTKAMKH